MKFEERVRRLIDDELTEEERRLLFEEAASDSAKQEYLDEMVSLCSDAAAFDAPAPPPELADRILARARQEAHASPPLRARLVPVLVAASVAFLLGLGVGRWAPRVSTEEVAPGSASLVVVRFAFQGESAEQVALVGSFNRWDATADPMRLDGPGLWVVEVPLPPGRHEYGFLVDGQWVADPLEGERIEDGFGRENSVLRL